MPLRHLPAGRFAAALFAAVVATPYPFSSRTIAPGDYRATLRVTR